MNKEMLKRKLYMKKLKNSYYYIHNIVLELDLFCELRKFCKFFWI